METTTEYIEKDFKRFILKNNHPCVMAQTVFKQDNFEIKNYDNFTQRGTARKLLKDLGKYIKNYDETSNEFLTFIAVFENEKELSEIQFEKLLWMQLQMLSYLDETSWDRSVSSNPEDSNFSFSVHGRAFYIVGMHPESTRKARRSPYPCMVFNLHGQFEKLREMNVYRNLRDRIRRRDKQQNGSVNPMLADFGEVSEARQYSGRMVGDNWECPFNPDGT